MVKHGGLVDNERYDDRGRWNGGINFAGEIFPRMKNYTLNNRATSVGNQLLNNYKKFLLAYERAWRAIDMPDAAPLLPEKRTVRMKVERCGKMGKRAKAQAGKKVSAREGCPRAVQLF